MSKNFILFYFIINLQLKMLNTTQTNSSIDVIYQLTNVLFPLVALSLALVSLLCLKIFNSISQNTIVFRYIRLHYVANSICLLFTALYAPLISLLLSHKFLTRFFVFVHHAMRSLRRTLFVIIVLNRFLVLSDKQISNKKNYMLTSAIYLMIIGVFCVPDLLFHEDSLIHYLLETIESILLLSITIVLTLSLVLAIRKRATGSNVTKVVFYNRMNNKQDIRFDYQKEESIQSSKQGILQVNTQNQDGKVSKLVVLISIVFSIDQSINICKMFFIHYNGSARLNIYIRVFTFLYEIIFNLSDLFIYCKFNDRFAQSLKMNHF
jgi:hypothetical protein